MTPISKPFLEDDAKDRTTLRVRKQESLGKAIKITIISGVHISPWTYDKKIHTLHDKMINIKSIYEKIQEANSREGRGIARSLPLFIRDHFKLNHYSSVHQK